MSQCMYTAQGYFTCAKDANGRSQKQKQKAAGMEEFSLFGKKTEVKRNPNDPVIEECSSKSRPTGYNIYLEESRANVQCGNLCMKRFDGLRTTRVNGNVTKRECCCKEK